MTFAIHHRRATFLRFTRLGSWQHVRRFPGSIYRESRWQDYVSRVGGRYSFILVWLLLYILKRKSKVSVGDWLDFNGGSHSMRYVLIEIELQEIVSLEHAAQTSCPSLLSSFIPPSIHPKSLSLLAEIAYGNGKSTFYIESSPLGI